MRKPLRLADVKENFDGRLKKTAIISDLQDEMIRQQTSLMMYDFLRNEVKYENSLRTNLPEVSEEEHLKHVGYYKTTLAQLLSKNQADAIASMINASISWNESHQAGLNGRHTVKVRE